MPYKPGTRPHAPIGKCGHPTWRGNGVCRSCYLAEQRKTIRHCQDCGKALPRRGNDGAARCRECWRKMRAAEKARRVCLECGKPTAKTGTIVTRCWECEAKRRHANRVIVNLPGRVDRRTTNPEGRNFRQQRKRAVTLRGLIGPLPCAICGYNKLKSRIHRIVAETGYVWGNVVQVCSNCHYEIHAGITPCPPATTPP